MPCASRTTSTGPSRPAIATLSLTGTSPPKGPAPESRVGPPSVLGGGAPLRRDSHAMASSTDDKRLLLARLLRDKAQKPKFAPLSFVQQRLWFVDQFSPASAVGTMAVQVRLHGALDRGALEASVQEVV